MWFIVLWCVMILLAGCLSMKLTRSFIRMLDPTLGIVKFDDNKRFDRIFQYIFTRELKPFERQVEFLKLFKRCWKLKNKKRKDSDRYIPCIAYTNAFTFGGAVDGSVREYMKFKRAWLAILYAKVMATLHDYFFLDKKHYGIIYYVEEK